jgi:glycosyltransferase involved in cell wall biosynthesis
MLLFIFNFALLRFPHFVILLKSRAHIAKRYRINPDHIIFSENYPNLAIWKTEHAWQPHSQNSHKKVRFFYHGELLWWHGIENFEAILDELEKYIDTEVRVAGNLYPTGFELLGITLCRKETTIKKEIGKFLRRKNVVHLGRIDHNKILQEMSHADFQVSQLRTRHTQAETELRTCLLEAMAFGIPCLHAQTAAISSHPELRNMENIIIVDTRQPKLSAEHILSLYRSPEKLKQIGENARLTISESFNLDKWFSQFKNQYLEFESTSSKQQKTRDAIPFIDLLTRPILLPLYLTAAFASYPFMKIAQYINRSQKKTAIGPNDKFSSATEEPKEKEIPPDNNATAFPYVSIVVPALNAESTIAACASSLIRQDYPHKRFETILADNGSTDQTREIAKRYGVRVVEEERKGAAAARNCGARAATGDFIAFIDADCIAPRDWLRRLVASVSEGDYDAVGGAISGKDLPAYIEKFYKTYAILDQQKAVAGQMMPFPFIITANCIFGRKVFERFEGFDERFPGAAAEDVDLGWRITFAEGKLGYSPDALVYHWHRITPTGLYFQYYKYGLSEIILYRKHRSRFRKQELRRLLWFRGQDYRCFWRMLLAMLFNAPFRYERFQHNVLFILKELGYVCGKIHAHLFGKPES